MKHSKESAKKRLTCLKRVLSLDFIVRLGVPSMELKTNIALALLSAI